MIVSVISAKADIVDKTIVFILVCANAETNAIIDWAGQYAAHVYRGIITQTQINGPRKLISNIWRDNVNQPSKGISPEDRALGATKYFYL